MSAPKNHLKRDLLNGDTKIGLWVGFAHPTAAEIAARSGFDWIMIDCEHGPNDIPLIHRQVQAAEGSGAAIAVRVPVGRAEVLKPVLDLGVQTVLVPMIDTPEQASEMVRAVRFPPEGIRGVGASMVRATGFGANPGYLKDANDEICLMVQAETRQAIENIGAIAGTDGVDCVFIGPADLAADMGHRGNPDAPEVVEAIAHAVGEIRKAGKAAGIFCFDRAAIAEYRRMGYNFLGVGGDLPIFAQALRAQAEAARQAIGD